MTLSDVVRRVWRMVFPGKTEAPDEFARAGVLPELEMTTSIPILTLPEAADPDRDAAAAGLDQAAIRALPEDSALLVVQRGHTAGARYLLDAERTTAGRHPHSDIFLDDATVSRRHAEFLRRDGQFVVRDAGALNGTYVNRNRIDETILHDGDEVWIGKYRLVFHPSRSVRT